MDAASLIGILRHQKNIWLASGRTEETALNELLCRLHIIEPKEYEALPTRSREYLYTLLKSKDPEIISPLLLAFQRLEDHRATPYITRLAFGAWSADHYQAIRKMANECLQVLQTHSPNMDSYDAFIADITKETNRHQSIMNSLLILFFGSSVVCCGLILWAIRIDGGSLLLSNPLVISYKIAGLSSISTLLLLVVFHSSRAKGKNYQHLNRLVLFRQQPLTRSDLPLLASLVDTIPFGCLTASPKTYKEALIELLNAVTVEDARLLNERQQSILWTSVFTGWSSTPFLKGELAAAVIQAMNFIGGEEMLLQIQRVADSESLSEDHAYVIGMAQKNIPLMKTRLYHQKLPDTLLRPSAQNTSPDILLRPTSSMTQTTPEETEQLLRPISSKSL